MCQYPEYGKSLIECSKSECKWQGYETDLQEVQHKKISYATQKVCPKCGNDSYYFVKETADDQV